MSGRSVIHDTFVIERSYLAIPSRVFAAFASTEAKSNWRWIDRLAEDDGAVAAEFDFRLPKLGGFSGENEIARSGQLHAPTEAVAMHRGNREAICNGQASKHRVKCAEHLLNAFMSVIGNVGACTECFCSSALENHKI